MANDVPVLIHRGRLRTLRARGDKEALVLIDAFATPFKHVASSPYTRTQREGESCLFEELPPCGRLKALTAFETPARRHPEPSVRDRVRRLEKKEPVFVADDEHPRDGSQATQLKTF